ncbi:uncharacterized protein LOC124365951 [Homalodisca vitripennis]|uniref:uncharacterized protein LOC124365951 n=1 Tax=Homalodisca vitripennis TaxID=197043 RepID=UPI001EEB192C|nr:uncharacterized protein LOC124365951 [Homalodisca vitripennis]
MAKMSFVPSFLLVFFLVFVAASYDKRDECIETMFTTVAEGIDPNRTCEKHERCGFWVYDWEKDVKYTSDIMTNACICHDWQKCLVNRREENYAMKYYACRCVNVTDPESKNEPDLDIANLTTIEPGTDLATEREKLFYAELEKLAASDPAEVLVTEPTKEPVTENRAETSDDL